MNIFKSGIDNALIYDILYNRKHQLVIKRLINDSKKILKYYNSIQIKTIDIDSFIDYVMCKYIISMENDNEQLNLLKKNIQEKMVINYQIKSIVDFIEKEYLNIKNLTIDTKEQLIVINQIMQEIKEKNIKNISLEKMFRQYSIQFFDNIEYFYKENKNMFFRMLTKDDIVNELVNYSINQLFIFIRVHKNEIKKSQYYNKIIIKIKEGIILLKDVYKKEQYLLQFIYLLEELKDNKVYEIKKEHKSALEEKNRFITENGIMIKNDIDLNEPYEKLEQYMKDDKNDLRIKFIKCFVTQRRKKCEILLNDIDRRKPSLVDMLMGNSHSYYKPFKKMCFENIYLQTSMNAFMDIYIKNYGYEEIENTLENLFRDIYHYIFFQEDDELLYKQEAENIVKTIKNFKDIKSKYTNYVDVFYISSVLERLLSQILISTCLDRNSYIDNCTLKDVFDENVNSNLKVIIGETLYRWLKYFLYIDREEKDGFIIKEGWNIRNTIAHGKYKITDDLSGIYYILIYLLINLLWSIDFRMIVYPTSKTEKILKRSFKNSI